MPGYFNIPKHPDEKYALRLEFEAPDLEGGETITGGVVTITPSGDTDDLVTDGNLAIGANSVAQVVKKGRDGIRYTILFEVTTSIGYVYVEKIFVEVEA